VKYNINIILQYENTLKVWWKEA